MKLGLYQHYKGGLYLVLGVAEHSETHEICVVYVSLDSTLPGPRLRVRPLNGPGGWNTPIQTDNKEKPTLRFEYLGGGQ